MAVTLETLKADPRVYRKGLSDAQLQHVLGAAAALCGDFLSGGMAPDQVLDEAVLRTVGALSYGSPLNVEGSKVGSISTDYVKGLYRFFDRSGAKELLAPFKSRTVAAIG